MNKSARLLLICMALCGGALSSLAASSFSPVSARVSLALPAASLDFSDLDLRDENNQPITSVQARREMEALFSEGLFNLMLMNLTPAKRVMMALLNLSWNGSFGCLKRGLGSAARTVTGWLKDKKLGRIVASTVHRSSAPIVHGVAHRPAFVALTTTILSSTILLR